jgi:hypothetical protein
MNNVFVYCEVEGTTVAEVSLELLTKGRKLANQRLSLRYIWQSRPRVPVRYDHPDGRSSP